MSGVGGQECIQRKYDSIDQVQYVYTSMSGDALELARSSLNDEERMEYERSIVSRQNGSRIEGYAVIE